MLIRESRIKVLMDKEGIPSQAELARRCGMKPQGLNRAIKGRQKNVGGTVIDRLCQALNAQPGDFLFWEAPDDSAPA